jgi:hypothetical protein
VRSVLLLAMVAACGPPLEVTPDAAGAASDAAPLPGRRCSPLAPFDEPMPVAIDGTEGAAIYAGGLSVDELTIYLFGRLAGQDGAHIFGATRDDPAEGFGAPVEIDVGPGVNAHPRATRNGLTLFFNSDRDTDPQPRIYEVTRASTTEPFADPVPLAGMPDQIAAHAALTDDDRQLWFFSVTTAQSLWRGELFDGGMVDVEDLDWRPGESEPVLSNDGLTIYVTAGPAGDIDIYRAYRDRTDEPFPDPAPVPELRTSSAERPAWLSDDGCRLYLTSDRDGSERVYVATKQPGLSRW